MNFADFPCVTFLAQNAPIAPKLYTSICGYDITYVEFKSLQLHNFMKKDHR